MNDRVYLIRTLQDRLEARTEPSDAFVGHYVGLTPRGVSLYCESEWQIDDSTEWYKSRGIEIV